MSVGAQTRGLVDRQGWHGSEVSAVAGELGVDPAQGLSAAEAASRLRTHGPHRLAGATKESGVQAFVRQYRDFMQLILLAAAIINLLVTGDVGTSVVLAGLTVFNAIVGLRQEAKAEESVQALAQMMKTIARVRRHGQAVEVDATELVPGDVVLLEAGNRVPADGRICLAATLEIEEAALTGESLPVAKRTGDHATTAGAIARELGIQGRPITGAEFAAMGDEELLAQLPEIGVVARVAPEDKLRLVRLLKRTFDEPTGGLMRRLPRPVGTPVLSRANWVCLCLQGLVMTVGTLAAYQLGTSIDSPEVATTMLVTTLSLFHVAAGLGARDQHHTIFARSAIPGPTQLRRYGLVVVLIVAVTTTIGLLQRLFDTTELSFSQWSICVGIAASLVVLEELTKLLLQRRDRTATTAPQPAGARI
jgi:magnesium-transporting ATPase (P-type)